MEKPPPKSTLGRARHFLHCVILEQRAATEELQASNRELETLLEDMVSSRSELRGVGTDETEGDSPPPPRPEPPDVRVVDLKRELESVVELGATAIKESMRLRRRSQQIRAALRNDQPKTTRRAGSALSKREHQVLTLIVEGKSSKEIAAELGISFKTAVTHRASIMSKLDVHEIASVVREAIRRGLV
jgi:DNA-binding CsgD family transcriptional regulator